jgi:hypothetical protein
VILGAIITLTYVLVEASRCFITALAPTALVDVVLGVLRLAVVDDTFSDRGSLVPLRCGLRMDRGLPFLPRGLRRMLRGKPVAPRGGTLSLLHGHSFEETSNLIVGPPGLGGRCSGILHRSMAAATMFWLARLKTGSSPTWSLTMR